MKRRADYSYLLEFCMSDTQTKAVQAAVEMPLAKAAKKLGINIRALERTIQRVKHNAAKAGLAPEENLNFKVPEGFGVDRISSFLDDEGKVSRQWVIANRTKTEQMQAFNDAVESICELMTKPYMPKAAPKVSDKHIMVKYPIADAHLGLLTWHKEVGKDFDLKIADKIFRDAMHRVVESSPPAETALILDLGDTIHTDDSSNQTKASKHSLDVDGRFDRVFDAAIAILIGMIDIALTKHKNVIFRKTRGNHDPDMSVAISALIQHHYRNEPRVKVERSPSLFWWYQFGSTLHFSTHGHTTKHADLPEIMAHDCEAVWSQTKHRYIDSGHIHHQNVKECRTCIMESHNSMASGDSYNYGHGYRSKRNLKGIVYHEKHGEIQRNIVDIGVVE